MTRRRGRVEDFTVGWICALHIELTAAREALDEEFERIDEAAHYILGRIGKHAVAVGCLPAGQLGTSSAAAVAVHMQNTFPALQYGFMVGIAGGVPSKSADIRLGDVVISHHKALWGVVQYDFGKTGFGGQQFPMALSTLHILSSFKQWQLCDLASALAETSIQSVLSFVINVAYFLVPQTRIPCSILPTIMS